MKWTPSASAPWALLGDVHAALRGSLLECDPKSVSRDWAQTKGELAKELGKPPDSEPETSPRVDAGSSVGSSANVAPNGRSQWAVN